MLYIAPWLLFFFNIGIHSQARITTKNSDVQRAPSWKREAPLPVLIVLLSYCSVVSVLLNPCLVAFEYLAVNKATRRISLVEVVLRYFLSSVLFLFNRRSYRSISVLSSMVLRATRRYDSGSNCRSSLRSIDRQSRDPSYLFHLSTTVTIPQNSSYPLSVRIAPLCQKSTRADR